MDVHPGSTRPIRQWLAWKMATQGGQLTLLDRLNLDTEPMETLQQIRFCRSWSDFVRHHRSRKFYLNGPSNSGQLVDYFVFCYPKGPDLQAALELRHYPLYRYLVDNLQDPIPDGRRFFARAVQSRLGDIVLDLLSRPQLIDGPLFTKDYEWAACEFAEDGSPSSLAVCQRILELAQQQGSHASKRSILRVLLTLEKRQQLYVARAFYEAMGPWELSSQTLLTMASSAGAAQFIVDFKARWQQDLGPNWYRYLGAPTLGEVYGLLEAQWRTVLQPGQVLPEYELLLERTLSCASLFKQYDQQDLMDFAFEFRIRLDFRHLFAVLLSDSSRSLEAPLISSCKIKAEGGAEPRWICSLWELMLKLEGRSVLEPQMHQVILRKGSSLHHDDPYRRKLRNLVLHASPELLGC